MWFYFDEMDYRNSYGCYVFFVINNLAGYAANMQNPLVPNLCPSARGPKFQAKKNIICPWDWSLRYGADRVKPVSSLGWKPENKAQILKMLASKRL